MTAEPQLFRINPENRESEKIAEVEFASLGFQERRDIQEWVAANPGILGDDLLIIGKEFSDFDRTDERLDLLAVDTGGKLVVIELKRDDSGADAHWQAIKYASYLQRASADDIIRMLAEYSETSDADATDSLLQHLNADDFNSLNNDQRIILASHRFAPEVTSAALWLNEKAPSEDLITCVQLTPYQDGENGSLYVQANTIIPVPGVDDYVIGIGDSSNDNILVKSGRSKLAQTFARNSNDDVTHFLRRVADRAIATVPGHLRPDKRSRWAGENKTWGFRYYHLWYSRPPWGNWKVAYFVRIPFANDGASPRLSEVGLGYWKSNVDELQSRLERLTVYDDQTIGLNRTRRFQVTRPVSTLDEVHLEMLASTISKFIQVVTPEIDSLDDERNQQDV